MPHAGRVGAPPFTGRGGRTLRDPGLRAKVEDTEPRSAELEQACRQLDTRDAARQHRAGASRRPDDADTVSDRESRGLQGRLQPCILPGPDHDLRVESDHEHGRLAGTAAGECPVGGLLEAHARDPVAKDTYGVLPAVHRRLPSASKRCTAEPAALLTPVLTGTLDDAETRAAMPISSLRSRLRRNSPAADLQNASTASGNARSRLWVNRAAPVKRESGRSLCSSAAMNPAASASSRSSCPSNPQQTRRTSEVASRAARRATAPAL